MPKATLTFDLSDQDDAAAYKRCNQAQDMSIALWDIGQMLRAFRKHGNFESQNTPKEGHEAVELIEQEFYKTLEHHNIQLDD